MSKQFCHKTKSFSKGLESPKELEIQERVGEKEEQMV